MSGRRHLDSEETDPGRGSSLVVDDIGALLTLTAPAEAAAQGPLGERTARALGLVRDAAVAIVDGRVVYAGPASGLPVGLSGPRLSAEGRLVSPGLVDPHTHPIWAGSRSQEFDLRNQGASYLELQQAGGGILSTVRSTRAATDEALLASTRARLDRFLSHGVTCLEGKSGYDLSAQGELRLLRLLREAALTHPIELSPTLLAHVPPPAALGEERGEFVHALIEEALPTVAREGLAEAIDVYCDQGAFTLDETRLLLEAGQRQGLLLRCHAEQFSFTGAAQLAASVGARSVEHLEELTPACVAALARAGTVCNLLPGAVLTLRLPWPDARRLLQAGCRVALGTDCNPGSSLTESQPLMMSLATTQLGLSVAEAWRAVTVEAAHAVGRPDRGRLTAGAVGDLVLWDLERPEELPQHLGAHLARTVVVAGEVVYART